MQILVNLCLDISFTGFLHGFPLVLSWTCYTSIREKYSISSMDLSQEVRAEDGLGKHGDTHCLGGLLRNLSVYILLNIQR